MYRRERDDWRRWVKAEASVASGKKSKTPSVIKEESSSEYEDVEDDENVTSTSVSEPRVVEQS